MLSDTNYIHSFAFRLKRPVDAAFWKTIDGHLAASRKLPGVLVCRMEKNISPFAGGWTHVYFGVFTDRAAHEAYQQHVLHDKIAAILLPATEWSAVSDLDLATPGTK